MELKEKGKYNCTCFANDPPTPEVHYLDCLDALRKGQNKSGVYSLKPDNMSPFKVSHFYNNFMVFAIPVHSQYYNYVSTPYFNVLGLL